MELFGLLRSPPSSVTFFSWNSSGTRALYEKTAAIPSAPILHNIPRQIWSCRTSGSRNHNRLIRASGTTQTAVPTTKNAASDVDKDLAFVAGATGRVGSRAVRELLKLGFRVRAGVRSAQRAEALIQSVREMKVGNAAGTSEFQPVEKLEIIECDLENDANIVPALGNASVVLCCIGASEKEVFDITGPYRIDYKATENLIKAATIAKVEHFILLTSLGTNKIGFPAAILNLFWGVLIWKRKAEEALIARGLPYTIVRPGGMERPTDSYKETHNLVLAKEDTYFGGQVSNLQVAELMAFMAKNPNLSYCKIVEVIAETTAPLLPMEELLAKIPSQREAPSNISKDSAPPMTEEKPAKLVVEEASSTNEVQKSRPLSPYTMYDDLKPPASPTPTPSVTPQTVNEKKVEVKQAKNYDSEPPAAPSSSSTDDVAVKDLTISASDKITPLSPYTAYEDLKPPTSPSPTPSSGFTISKGSTSNAGVPVNSTTVRDGAATGNPVVPPAQEMPQLTNGNSDYRSPYPVYEDLKPPTSPTPSSPKH